MNIKNKFLAMSGKRIAFDLDMTLTTNQVIGWEDLSESEFSNALYRLTPNKQMIEFLNVLAENNTVYIYTARSDIRQGITKKWLRRHGVNYSYFICNKPHYDYFIDDKNINANDLILELEGECDGDCENCSRLSQCEAGI